MFIVEIIHDSGRLVSSQFSNQGAGEAVIVLKRHQRPRTANYIEPSSQPPHLSRLDSEQQFAPKISGFRIQNEFSMQGISSARPMAGHVWLSVRQKLVWLLFSMVGRML
jgi:hypothetical protein